MDSPARLSASGPVVLAEDSELSARSSGSSRILRRLLAHKLFLVGGSLLAFILLLVLFAPLLVSVSPDTMQFAHRFATPGGEFLLGTDNFGRDVFSRILFGAQLSLLIGASVVLITGVVGTVAGLLSGYFRVLDGPIMRVMDALMAFPSVLLAIGIAAALGSSVVNAIIALSAVYLPRVARVVRASALVIREMDYVAAAKSCGAGSFRILIKHLFPNSLAPLIIQLTFIFSYAILAEAMLSFLGLGPPPPTATWGNMIAEGRTYMREAPWLTLFPGIAIAITVLSLNLVGDALRDVLDPRMKIQQG